MKISAKLHTLFKHEIDIKFQIFNSLFTNLPFKNVRNIGNLLPILEVLCEEGLQNSKTPTQIMELFFYKYAYLNSEEEQITFLFSLIQYIERQVVLFDSVEDAAFSTIHKHLPVGTIDSAYHFSWQNDYVLMLKEKIKQNKVRIVYTAHPTQFYPNDVLRIISDIQTAIKKNEYSQIVSLLGQLGKTPFINHTKPTPLEEARSIMYYLRYINYETIKKLHTKIVEYFYDDVDDFVPIVELGFWPGGDRDGNPFVTAETTLTVARELRYDILACYYQDLKALTGRLTFKRVKELIVALKNEIYENLYKGKQNITVERIITDLHKIKTLLINEYDSMFVGMVDIFIRQVQTFGLHFATIDIRQDSSKHDALIAEIARLHHSTPYTQLSDEERMNFLMREDIFLEEKDYDDAISRDTIANIKQLRAIQKSHGEKAIHRYIVSNTTTHWHILELFAFFRFCGYDAQEINFDFVPLFETIEGLSGAADIMEKLYTNPFYAKHLQHRQQKQTIMLGFSDGTKDGGYLRANWEIFTNKEKLTAISRKYDVDVVFFDGRGGPPGRGGGKTHQFYASQGEKIASREIHLTLQGQTISSQYGSIDQALYNMEQLVTASLLAQFDIKHNATITPTNRALIEEMAFISHKKYLELKTHPLFIPYLERYSVLPFYANTNIGSRPAKRGNADTELKLTDLRAIPFVGSWSQIKQNIPGYFGFGTGVEVLIQKGKLEDIQQLYQASLYFKTLVQNSMMSLAKTNFALTNYISDDPTFGKFWQLLFEEYQLSVKNLLMISQENELMQKEILNKLSIRKREKIVLPLMVLQQYALQKMHALNNHQAIYQKIATRAIFGGINASRNSA